MFAFKKNYLLKRKEYFDIIVFLNFLEKING